MWLLPRPFGDKVYNINPSLSLWQTEADGSRGRASHNRSNNSFWLHFLSNWWKHPLFNRNVISASHTSLAHVRAHCLLVGWLHCALMSVQETEWNGVKCWKLINLPVYLTANRTNRHSPTSLARCSTSTYPAHLTNATSFLFSFSFSSVILFVLYSG